MDMRFCFEAFVTNWSDSARRAGPWKIEWPEGGFSEDAPACNAPKIIDFVLSSSFDAT